jgi:hypothetical protein
MRRIDVSIKGSCIVSRNILLIIHVNGMTANKIEAIIATFLPYLYSVILYNRKVSNTAKIPIITRGTKYNCSTGFFSPSVSALGKPIMLNIPAKKICPK